VPPPLGCPHCDARFAFADWAQSASCPSCGARVTFSEAAAVSAGDGPVAVPMGDGPATGLAADGRAGGPVLDGPAGTGSGHREFLGKPLAWTRGWKTVVAVWIVCAALLLAARIGMGHVSVYTPAERAAIAAVHTARFEDGVTYEQALQQAERVIATSNGRQSADGHPPVRHWWAVERSWEKRIYVVCELQVPGDSQPVQLGWWVEGDKVTADPATRAFLAAVEGPQGRVSWPDPPAFLER
jgi:hypothetical protein